MNTVLFALLFVAYFLILASIPLAAITIIEVLSARKKRSAKRTGTERDTDAATTDLIDTDTSGTGTNNSPESLVAQIQATQNLRPKLEVDGIPPEYLGTQDRLGKQTADRSKGANFLGLKDGDVVIDSSRWRFFRYVAATDLFEDIGFPVPRNTPIKIQGSGEAVIRSESDRRESIVNAIPTEYPITFDPDTGTIGLAQDDKEAHIKLFQQVLSNPNVSSTTLKSTEFADILRITENGNDTVSHILTSMQEGSLRVTLNVMVLSVGSTSTSQIDIQLVADKLTPPLPMYGTSTVLAPGSSQRISGRWELDLSESQKAQIRQTGILLQVRLGDADASVGLERFMISK